MFSLSLCVPKKVAMKLIQTWTKCPKDQHIPLKEQAIGYAIKTIAQVALDVEIADEQTIKTILTGYDVVNLPMLPMLY